MEKCFNWILLRPIYAKDNTIKGDKIDYHLYLLQQVKVYQFIQLNDQEVLNEDLH